MFQSARNIFRFSLVVVFGTISMVCARANADTYSIASVRFTQQDHFAAGNDYGDYVIDITQDALGNRTVGCGGASAFSQCFEAHYASSNTNVISTFLPTLAVDPAPIAGDLGSCAIPASFGGGTARFCNNGHMLIAGLFGSGSSMVRGIWDGDSVAPTAGTRLSGGTMDGGFMTANGNAFFIDGVHDTLDVALDLSATPAPEPGSLLLLGTGAVAACGVLRRKLA